MRFHPLAVSIVIGACSTPSIVNAFVLPKSSPVSRDVLYCPTSRNGAGTTSVDMVAQNKGSPYISLEEKLFEEDKSSGNTKPNNIINNEPTPSKNSRKPNARTEKIRAKLQADLAAAEESRARTAEELADAESSRLALEARAVKAAKKAEALEAKFNAFEAKEAARAAAGGGLSAARIVGEIAGPLVGGAAAFGGLAAARNSLAARTEKAEEERLRREEEVQRAEEAAKRKASQKNISPFVGAGVAGLGALGAFLGLGSPPGGSGTDDIMSKNEIRDTTSKQQTRINQKNILGDSSATVDLPYLDNKIAKVETKQAVIEAEKKDILVTEAAERKAAAEKAAAEKANAEKIAADKIAFERIKAQDAKAAAVLEKMEADKLFFQKVKVEQQAKSPVALQSLKEQNTQSRGFIPKVPAVSEMLFGNNRPSMITDRGLSNIFSPNIVVVGGVALVGVAVATAVVAADDSPSISKTFKVTGKSPKESFESEEVNPSVSNTLKKTIRIPQTKNEKSQTSSDVTPTTSLPGSKEALREELERKRANLNKQAREKPSIQPNYENTQSSSSPGMHGYSADTSGAEKTVVVPHFPKHSFSPFKGGKPKAVGSDSLYSPPVSSSIMSEINGFQPAEHGFEPAEQEVETISDQYAGEETSFGTVPKSSYSPFGSGKPKAAASDSLYSPPASQSVHDTGNDTPTVQSFEQAPKNDIIGEYEYIPTVKNSFSPFKGGKPKAVGSDSLYSPPVSSSLMSETNGFEPAEHGFEPAEQEVETISDQYAGEETSFGTVSKSSYSPFGSGKPKAAASDSLYTPPANLVSNSEPYTNDSADTSFPASTVVGHSLTTGHPSNDEPGNISPDGAPLSQESPYVPDSSMSSRKNYSPFSGDKPISPKDDLLYRPPTLEDSSHRREYDAPVAEPRSESTGATLSENNSSSFDDTLYFPSTNDPSDANRNEGEPMPFVTNDIDNTLSADDLPLCPRMIKSRMV